MKTITITIPHQHHQPNSGTTSDRGNRITMRKTNPSTSVFTTTRRWTCLELGRSSAVRRRQPDSWTMARPHYEPYAVSSHRLMTVPPTMLSNGTPHPEFDFESIHHLRFVGDRRHGTYKLAVGVFTTGAATLIHPIKIAWFWDVTPCTSKTKVTTSFRQYYPLQHGCSTFLGQGATISVIVGWFASPM